jgi:plastocyanin
MSRWLAIAAIAVAAACGNGTSYSNPPPPPPPAPPPPPPPGGHSTTITIANTSFSPTPDTIPAGNITFHWGDAVTHNVTWQTGPAPLPAGSGNRAGGDADYVTALVAGDYTYHCTIHPTQMNGVIHVNP